MKEFVHWTITLAVAGVVFFTVNQLFHTVVKVETLEVRVESNKKSIDDVMEHYQLLFKQLEKEN